MQQQEKWTLKKEIDLSHVFTMAFLIVGGMTTYADLDKNISSNAQAIESVKDSNEKAIESIKEQRKEDRELFEKQTAENRARFEKRLDSIDGKLDRLIEKN